MKRFMKNNIKVFVTMIITTIVVGSLSVYAASQYFAKDINFTPTNENFIKENGEPIDNVEDALNELYYKSNLLFNSNNITILANNNYDYTFTENYDYVLVSYLTNSWTNTNYYVSGINDPISSLKSGNNWGLVQLVYSNVKVGNKIVLGGSATKSIIIAGINN